MPYHLVLVHGTWAHGALWTREATSTLCRHLKAELDEPSFSYSDWSGKNTHRARVDGARELIAHVTTVVPDTHPLVLVGHSHGGTVIAQALVDDERLCRRLAGGGVVFLSTPFLHARLLPLAKNLPRGPALLAGIVCGAGVAGAVIVALMATTDWPRTSSPWLNGVAFAALMAFLCVLVVVFDRVSQWLGAGDGQLTAGADSAVATLIGQLDLVALAARGVNQRSLLVRSTADEAAGGLAAAQMLGRLASDGPVYVWQAPARIGWQALTMAGFSKNEPPPRWFGWAFAAGIMACILGVCVAMAAWLLPGWELLHAADRTLREVFDRVVDAGAQGWVWLVTVVLLVLLTSVPLMVTFVPFKLLSLLAYGLRGWPVLRAMFVELSVEPAPPGAWRLHQLNAGGFEAAPPLAENTEHSSRGAADRTWAHSYIYDDVRAHRLIACWLAAGCKGIDAPRCDERKEGADQNRLDTH